MHLHTAAAAALLAQVLVEMRLSASAAVAIAAAAVALAGKLFVDGARGRVLLFWGGVVAALFASLSMLEVSAHPVRSPDAATDAHAWSAVASPEKTLDVTELLDDSGGSASALTIVADVVEPPRSGGAGASAVVEARAMRAFDGTRRALCGRVLLSVRHAADRLRLGQRIELRARLRRITRYGNPGEFDYARWSARRGVHVSAFVWDERDVAVLGVADEVSRLTRLRARIAEAARGSRGAAGALTAALVVGDRTGLDRDVLESLRGSGLSHLLAISGMNVGAVAGFVLWVAMHVGRAAGLPASGYDPFRVPAVTAGVAVVGYAALSGGGESVVRATVMALLMLAASWWGRRGDAWRALSVAALLLAAISPGSPAEAGFQLSFAATAAVLVAVRAVQAAEWPCRPGDVEAARWRRMTRVVIAAIAISVLCWAVTAPIIAHHFRRFSLVAPLASVAAALPSSLVVIAGLAGACLTAFAPDVAAVAYDVAALGGAAILAIARIAAAPQWAEHVVVAPGGLLAACAAALPLLVWEQPRLRRRRLAVALVAAVLGCTAHAAWMRYRADRLDLVFVAVGQGDAAVVRLPGGRVIVADAGPPGRGRTAVGPLLGRMHVARVDTLVVSHVQDDHWGGGPDLTDEVDVAEVWIPGGRCRSRAFSQWIAELGARGTRIVDVGATLERKARKGRAPYLTRRGRQGWRYRAVWPPDDEGSCDANDRSVVVAVEYAGTRILLTGDVEARAERALAARARADGIATAPARLHRAGASLRAGVLKVPHHGSRTSSTAPFLDAVAPQVAVASLGTRNRYGFPHADVEARYAARGVTLYRTDLDGAVRVVVDAAGVAVAPTLVRGAERDDVAFDGAWQLFPALLPIDSPSRSSARRDAAVEPAWRTAAASFVPAPPR